MTPGAAIEAQERAGQQQLVNSDRLPSDITDRPAFEAFGFTFGDPDPADPMFLPATLPPGWKREGSDHAMWSYIVDELGRQRAGIFYKAAFYDRRDKLLAVLNDEGHGFAEIAGLIDGGRYCRACEASRDRGTYNRDRKRRIAAAKRAASGGVS